MVSFKLIHLIGATLFWAALFVNPAEGFRVSLDRPLNDRSRLLAFRHFNRHVRPCPLRSLPKPSRPTTPLGCAASSLMLRGGDIAGLSVPLTAKLCSGFLMVNGLALMVAPVLWTDSLYKIGIEEGTFDTFLLRAIGAISAGLSINVFLIIVKGMAVQKAMGYALLPRLIFLLRSLLAKKFDSLGSSKKFLSINTAVMSWTTYSLLTGAGNPALAAKVFSSLAIFKGALLTFRPNVGAVKYFGMDVSGEDKNKARALAKALGNYLVTSAFLMASLAYGMNPVKSVGYTSLMWALLLFEMGFVSKTYRLMDEVDARAQTVHLFISLGFAAGFLL